MTTFDDREKAFESKYAHDQEMQFRAEARRNKLLGLLAAELLGKSADEAAEYARAVIKADFEEAGHEDVVRKVAADLDGIADAEAVRAKMAELLVVAKAQLMSDIVAAVASSTPPHSSQMSDRSMPRYSRPSPIHGSSSVWATAYWSNRSASNCHSSRTLALAMSPVTLRMSLPASAGNAKA